jgi:transposase
MENTPLNAVVRVLSFIKKIFDCPHCGVEMDKDVNGARDLFKSVLGN